MGPGQPSIVVQPGTKGGGRPDLRIRLLSHALFGAPHSKSPEEHNGCLERDTEVARHKRAKLAEPVEEGSQNFRLLRSETKELDELCNYQPHRVLAFLDASDVLGFGFKQTPSFALEEDSVVFVSTRRAACCSSQRSQGGAFKLRAPSRLSPPPTDDPDLVSLSFAPLCSIGLLGKLVGL